MMEPAFAVARRCRLAGVALAILAGTIALSACAKDRSYVRGGGTIEMDEVDVSSLVGGRIVRMRVNEGDTVRAGDTLAVLDRGELRADLAAQAAQAARAVAQLRDLQAGPRSQEIDSARAQLQAATAQAALAGAGLRRLPPVGASVTLTPNTRFACSSSVRATRGVNSASEEISTTRPRNGWRIPITRTSTGAPSRTRPISGVPT